ncbi:alpha/beta fold hydrolase [Algirhabdus cladophorae]|uniref:alpha/beta fold hydrolase n=1 Tax=Algirhabdus cladophorae TaxID=3377108 RepID=UPI003B8464C4
MPSQTVHCARTLDAAADDIWAVLKGFDLTWHPYVVSCNVLRDAGGAMLRDFETTDHQRLVEQRTFISDTDRVLCYTALSGIEGALRYAAHVEVAVAGDQTLVTWQADITASADRLGAIAEGTQAVFEAGLEALGQDLPQLSPRKQAQADPVPLVTQAIANLPQLSVLTSQHTKHGSDTLVLFLHGIGGQASNWSEQIGALGGTYSMAAMDLRGYGGSSLGASQTQIDDYCADILSVVAHFNAKRLVLVGLSMGSWIATSFAMRHGDMLAGLVLAGGCTGMSEADPVERENFLKSREVPLARGQTPADFASDVVDVIAGPNARADVRARLHKSMSDISAATYRDALNCFCNPLEKFDFAKITCPVLLVTGEQDKLAPPGEIRQVARRIFVENAACANDCDVRFEVLPDAGHLCNIEQPDAFNAQLSHFLERLPYVALGYKPTRLEKQRQKRAQILRAAHAEFCDAGFDGASMDRLARAADVSKPTLYQYFNDKEGLFAAVLDQGRAHIIAPLAGQGGTLVDRLWRFSWTYAEFVLRPDLLSLARLILGEAGRRPESALQYHQSGPARAFEGLVDFVAAAHVAGELDVVDAQLAANDLWSLILSGPRDHYLHYVNERPSQDELLHVIAHGLDMFLRAYSCNLSQDQKDLGEKVSDLRSRIGK